jgi:multidrug resistance efflux pump
MSPSTEQLQQLVQQALTEFERLAASEQPPTPVLGQMLTLQVRALQALAAAAWMPADAGGADYRPMVQVGPRSELAGSVNGPDSAAQRIVMRTVAENRPIAVSPEQGEFDGSPLHPLTQFFIPVDALGKVAAVIHLVLPGELDPKIYRNYVTFAQQGARSAAVYFARRQSQLMRDDAATHAGIVKLMQKLLKLGKPDQVVHELANHTRPMFGARRVCVVGYWRDRSEAAFSDAIDMNHRAVLVRSVQALADQVKARGVPMSFVRGQILEGEDEPLMPLLEQVYALGGGGAICLTPMRSGEEIVGVIAAEYDDSETASRRGPMQQELASQAGPILEYAIRWYTRPLRWVSDVLLGIRQKPLASTTRGLAILAAVATLVGVVFFMPVPLYVWSEARLEPAMLSAVSAPQTGRVVKVHVRTGDSVKVGDVLLELDDADLAISRLEAIAAIEGERVQVEANRKKGDAASVRAGELRIEQYQLRQRIAERQMERCKIRSLISGSVLTENLEQLVGNTVSEGDLLVQVADLRQFELVMQVPEAELSLVERSLREGRDVPVAFLSRPWPDHVQHSTITSLAALSPTSGPSERQQQLVFRITVPVQLSGLAPQLVLANPTGRAKLDTGTSSLAYRYGRDVWRFVQMTLLF